MRKTFVMRGQTASGETEVLNFGKYKQGYAYKITEFVLYPSTNIGGANAELCATITAGKTAVTPTDPNFNNDGLIATSFLGTHGDQSKPTDTISIVNDTYVITQNLILMVQETSGAGTPVNWQCRFESVKMSGAEEASVNYKQFAISDE
jgi:hypothetical protein